MKEALPDKRLNRSKFIGFAFAKDDLTNIISVLESAQYNMEKSKY